MMEIKFCRFVLFLSMATTLALGSLSMDPEIELFRSYKDHFGSLNNDEAIAANLAHSRKKRFIAFPRNSSCWIESILTAPISNVPGVTQMTFLTEFLFSLSTLFPLPATTTTVPPTTTPSTTTHSNRYAPPTHTPDGYGFSHRHDIPGNQDSEEDTPQFPRRSGSSSYSSYASRTIAEIESFSRIPFYEYLEDFMNNRGLNGRQCVLRTLCEVADAPFDHGLFGEIVNLILSASMDSADHRMYDDYMAAEHYGRYFGDCQKKFPECPESVLGLVSAIF